MIVTLGLVIWELAMRRWVTRVKMGFTSPTKTVYCRNIGAHGAARARESSIPHKRWLAANRLPVSDDDGEQ